MSYFRPKKQIETPTTGATVAIQNANSDIRLLLNPASTISALTVIMPSQPFDGQIINICSSQLITVLTINSSATILGTISSIGVNAFAGWVYNITNNNWYKIS